MKKWLIIVGVTLVALVIVGYVVVGTMVYNRLTDVAPHCDNDPVEYANTPAAFTLSDGVDPTPYLMPDYQEVQLSQPRRSPEHRRVVDHRRRCHRHDRARRP